MMATKSFDLIVIGAGPGGPERQSRCGWDQTADQLELLPKTVG